MVTPVSAESAGVMPYTDNPPTFRSPHPALGYSCVLSAEVFWPLGHCTTFQSPVSSVFPYTVISMHSETITLSEQFLTGNRMVTPVSAESAGVMPYTDNPPRFDLPTPPSVTAACCLLSAMRVILAPLGAGTLYYLSVTSVFPYALRSRLYP